MDSETTENYLQFAPYSSTLDAGFWQKLAYNKLNLYGLDEDPKPISGFYSNADPPGMSPRLSVDFTAFDSNHKTYPRCFAAPGSIYNTNTLDKFKKWDKLELLEIVGRQIWKDIYSGQILEEPKRLCPFLILTYADLKKYNFYYWCAFPCLSLYEPATIVSQDTVEQKFNPQQIQNFTAAYDKYQSEKPSFCGFFLIQIHGDEIHVDDIKNTLQLMKHSRGGQLYFGFADPCTLEGYPGWPLRNYLIVISYMWGKMLGDVNVLCFRDRTQDGKREIGHSLIFNVKMSVIKLSEDTAKCIGWEKNERSKLGPRHINLSMNLDPIKLAESAVNLNLILMKWRLLPELNLDKIEKTRVLLLGSGTLGCNVARGLMGWGVKHITLVDNAKVSYSNPIRQTLFMFEDCLDGGKQKAEAAAGCMKRIFPGVHSLGLCLSIPMPGHAIAKTAVEDTKRDVQKLEDLIETHDVVFLLMDTRESRWLPTLIGAAKKKIVINAALGFDTFLVLRHGVKTEHSSATSVVLGSPISGSQLGCYFCNDVVAPGNSTKDRTLDQQCTVTRPGVSMIASALAVELLVSIIQHPLGPEAPANTSDKEQHLGDDSECCLGMVPHQIRGFLSRFHHVLPASQAFDKCTACSQIVIDHYREEGFPFLLRAFDEPTYLEDLTGLTQMHQETMDDEVWDMSDEEESDSASADVS